MKRTNLQIAVAAALLATGGAASAATTETQENNSLAAAQVVPVPVLIEGLLGDDNGTAVSDDVDFFKFFANSGESVTVQIDGSVDDFIYGGVSYPLGLIVALYNPEGKLIRNEEPIEGYPLLEEGYYTVGIGNNSQGFIDGGAVQGVDGTGSYQLSIAFASVPTDDPDSDSDSDPLEIPIEIKPGNNEFAPINPKSRGKIPVAILSIDNTFDATQIDPNSLTFGSTGDEVSLHKCNWHGADMNGDGKLDMVCHFNNQDAKFVEGDREGTLKGKLKEEHGGTAFVGRGPLKVVPAIPLVPAKRK